MGKEKEREGEERSEWERTTVLLFLSQQYPARIRGKSHKCVLLNPSFFGGDEILIKSEFAIGTVYRNPLYK